MKYIDRTPTQPSGNNEIDIQELYSYLLYLQEQINYIFRLISKKMEG